LRVRGQRSERGVVLRFHVVVRGAEAVDVVVQRDPVEELLDDRLEAVVLVEVGVVPDPSRIDVRVEHHALHL